MCLLDVGMWTDLWDNIQFKHWLRGKYDNSGMIIIETQYFHLNTNTII